MKEDLTFEDVYNEAIITQGLCIKCSTCHCSSYVLWR